MDRDRVVEEVDKSLGEDMEGEGGGEGEGEGADLRRDDDSSKVLESAAPSIEALEAVLDRVVRPDEVTTAEAAAGGSGAVKDAGSGGAGAAEEAGGTASESQQGASRMAEGTIASPKKAPQ